jgi:hypothetical protein
MEVFEELGVDGYMDYKVEIGGEVLTFPTKEEREKFLWRLWMDLLQKMLRSQLLQEALEWLWEQRQEDMQKIVAEHFSAFVLLLIPWDNYFYFLPPAAAAHQAMARNLVGMAIDLLIQFSPPAPAVAPRETFEEALARTRAAKAAKNNNTDKPRG